MESINDSEPTQPVDSDAKQVTIDVPIEDNKPQQTESQSNDKTELTDIKEAETGADETAAEPIVTLDQVVLIEDTDTPHVNGTVDENDNQTEPTVKPTQTDTSHKQEVGEENPIESADKTIEPTDIAVEPTDIAVEPTDKTIESTDKTEKTSELPNGSAVTPKVTRSKRNSKPAEELKTPVVKQVVESQSNSEQRLTRSRYGRLQKAKTPNPEMITYDVKRRPSVRSNDSSTPSVEASPVKTDHKAKEDKEANHSPDATPKLRKSKRRISSSPRESTRKRQTNKIDSVIDQIKQNSNEGESTAKTGAQKSVKMSVPKETVPQKKCIELVGDPTTTIVERHRLLTIPKKEGDYTVGDLIWVKVSGYPFWPCMVSVDPITGVYSKISGNSHKAGHIYHVQYFGPQALRGWTQVGQVFPFEGRDKFLHKLEEIKLNSPKAQSAKIAAKYAVKPSQKREWDLSVDESEEASQLSREERVHSLTFEYKLLPKMRNLRRKSDNALERSLDSKRKKLNSSPEDIYDFDDDADAFNLPEATPGLMWRKRALKGDFAVYVERHLENVEKENPGADRQELEAMLQRRWDLLGDDLRALYTDRKSLPSAPKEMSYTPVSTPKTSTATKPKTTPKSNAKQVSAIKMEADDLDSNESDSEGNLVIAETPTKRMANKRASKASKPVVAHTVVSEKEVELEIKGEVKAEPKTPTTNKKVKKANTRSPKSSKSKTNEKKKVEQNGIKDATIAQTSEQSLVNFNIDYLDDFASSEDTSSTSEPEAAEGKSSYEKLCVICNESSESSDLVSCSGVCFQMFHRKCAKYEGLTNEFKCEECQSGKHSCFVCKKVVDDQQKETEKCADLKCGKFYHMSCLEKGYPIKMSDQKDSFVCPLHFCLNCHLEAQNDKDFRPSRRRLVKCISCPTAYHLGDYCIAAGTSVVSQNYVICPDHRPQKKSDRHVNINYCFSCLTGGQLVCCESCPAAFHQTCLDETFDPEKNFYCSDCLARKPLRYGDVVWVKLGFYRWWPGKISHPKAVPDNVMKLPHGLGEFPVYFFGSHDYFWVHKGRVFQYMEGDNKVMAASSSKKGTKSLIQTFKLATEEAVEQFKIWQDTKLAIRRAMVISKPPHYTHIKSNKAIGSKVQTNSGESQISVCECKKNNELTCNDENCINRALMVECDPKLCNAGDECQNQRFKKRQYVLSKPFKTENAGWGLRALEDIKKGQFVIEYVGELIDEEECQKRLKSAADNEQSNFYFLTIDKEKIIDAGPKGNLARFMNHSCQPNCETQKWMVNGATRVGLFAINDISAGTELTFNYNLDCRGNEKTRCVCGQPNCSGFIGVRPNKADDTQNKKSAANGQSTAKKKKKKSEKKATVVESEDHCFSCGEGGDLIMCDRKGCPKSYHLECLKLPQIPKGKWECPRHFCDTCGRPATALCAFCPNSVCRTHADPSKLTQLPDGGLMCLDHSDQDIDAALSQMEREAIADTTDDNIEAVREEANDSVVESEAPPDVSLASLEADSEGLALERSEVEPNES